MILASTYETTSSDPMKPLQIQTIVVFFLFLVVFASNASAARKIPYQVKSSPYFVKKHAYWKSTEDSLPKKIVEGIGNSLKTMLQTAVDLINGAG